MTRASDTARLLGAGGTFGGAITSNSGIAIDNITIDSTEIDLSSGSFTIDSASDITLDADGGDIKLKDGGTGFANFSIDNSGLTIVTTASDADFKINGVDGGANITALTLDMSDGGTATFNSGISATGTLLLNNSGSDSFSTIKGPPNRSLRIDLDANGNTDALIIRDLRDNSERFTVQAAGNVGIGTSSPDRDLVISDGGSGSGIDLTDTGSTGQIRIGKTFSGTTSAVIFKHSNTTVGTINFSNTGTSYNQTSDYRLKENVSYDFDATTRLKQLKPCRFNFKIDTDNTVDGFLAHEVSSVVPEAITGEKDAMTEEVLYVDGDEIPDGKKVGDVKEASKIDPQGIDQSKLVPLLVKTIQELEARITALESK